MDIKDIKKIIEMMRENDLTEFALEEEGFKINLKRRNGAEPQIVTSHTAPAPIMVAAPIVSAPVAAPAPVSASATQAGVAPAAPDAVPTNLKEIKSPMVGTVYRSSSPEAEPFVAIGKEVDEDTVVCIIEAMKVMNEIKAEMKGVIRKILVENATSVEFGQALFQVEPQ